MINLECKICSKTYKVKNYRLDTSHTCSNKCRFEYQNIYSKTGKLQRIDSTLLCNKCDKYKKETEFYNRNDYDIAKIRNGRSAICKSCINNINKVWSDRNTKTIRGFLSRSLTRAKTSCRYRKTIFDITLKVEDLLEIYNIQKGLCKLTNQEMILGSNEQNVISIDRIDSSKGYTKSNIQLVCWVVNQMKNDLSISDLKKWCTFIINNK